MKKIIRVVFLIVAVFTLNNCLVYAQDYDGIVYQAEAIPDIYFYHHRRDTAEQTYPTHNFHEQAHVFRRSSDNAYVYCVQNWVHLEGAKKGDFTEEDDDLELSAEVKERIELLAYYGYGYKDKTHDHTALKWYAITQYLIWEAEAPNVEHYFVESLQSTMPIHPYLDEINELLALVQDHAIKPRLVLPNNILIGDTFSITDENAVLSRFKVVSPTDDVSINAKDNSLTIHVAKREKMTIELEYKANRLNRQTKFYLSKNYQNCLAIGDLPPVTYTLELTPLTNFKVYKWGEVLDSSTLMEDNTYNFNYKYMPLKDIKFYLYAGADIYDQNHNLLYQKDALIGIYYSAEDGSFTESLPRGNYYIVEESSNEDYFVWEDKTEFAITDDDLQKTLNIYNNRKQVEIEFTKLGEKIRLDEEEIKYEYYPLANVSFGLYNAADIYNYAGELILPKDTLIKKMLTDTNGKAYLLTKMPYGIYYVKELDTNTSFALDTEKYILNYEPSLASPQQLKLVDPIINKLKKAELHIYKYDGETLKPLEGITYTFYNANQEVICKAITDAEGKITLNLPYGTYYYQETETLPEYIIDNQLMELVLDDNNTIVNRTHYNYRAKEVIVEVPKTDQFSYLSIFPYLLLTLLSGLGIKR